MFYNKNSALEKLNEGETDIYKFWLLMYFRRETKISGKIFKCIT